MITIVATHYRLPLQRLRDFFAWNDAGFRSISARVIIVSDVARDDLPDYARAIIFPAPLEKFALAKTSNYGIRQAARGIVCKTDPDIVFSRDALADLLYVRLGHGVAYTYRMAESYDARLLARPWTATRGTLALHYDDWARVGGYDERHEGYGWEDGDTYLRAIRAGVDVVASPSPVYHVAHAGGEQVRQGGRIDQWGRESGFNPPARAENIEISRSPWARKNWGVF